MMIIRQVGYFLEKHIEKIVFAIVGIVCIWLLVFYVLINPNAVSYDGKKFSPGEIDKHIREQAKELEYKLNQPPKPKTDYVSLLTGALDPNNPVREKVWGDLKHGFSGLFASAINGIDKGVSIPMPPPLSTQISDGKEYVLPVTDGTIGLVKDVSVEHIRAAAYVPAQPVTEEVTYDNSGPQPEDIDLVTVEAKFDVVELYRKFHDSFNSDFIKKEWRDPCLAVPVFAAVQLLRQEKLDNGNWSDWLVVPRSKIDHRRRIFEVVENVESLPPGGIAVRLLQFQEPDVKRDLLQPQAYQIASANEEWFPPTLHRKYVELRRKEKTEQRREEIEAKKKEEEQIREQRLEDRRGSGTGTGTIGPRTGAGRSGGEGYGTGIGTQRGRGTAADGARGSRGARAGTDRQDRRGGQTDAGYGDMGAAGGRQTTRGGSTRVRGRDERNPESDYIFGEGLQAQAKPSSNDVYYEFEQKLLTEWTDMSKMREPLMFWAFDDTIEPGKSYRYRIRLGVFNPIAGTNKFKSENKSYKDVVILWSDFSDVAEQVRIPQRMYLFAKDIQEAAKIVTVQVSKYVLGYWYSEDFGVKQGEAIGKVMELKPEPSLSPVGGGSPLSPRTTRVPSPMTSPRSAYSRGPIYDPRMTSYEQRTEPESIDYSTGAVLVDAVSIQDWSGEGNLRPRRFFDMLYSYDGTTIERTAISNNNWPKELQVAFDDIRTLQREPKEPLKGWQTGGGQRGRSGQRTPGLEGYEGLGGGMYDDMLYEGMRGGRRY